MEPCMGSTRGQGRLADTGEAALHEEPAKPIGRQAQRKAHTIQRAREGLTPDGRARGEGSRIKEAHLAHLNYAMNRTLRTSPLLITAVIFNHISHCLTTLPPPL
jgi:hypothetical protein